MGSAPLLSSGPKTETVMRSIKDDGIVEKDTNTKIKNYFITVIKSHEKTKPDLSLLTNAH